MAFEQISNNNANANIMVGDEWRGQIGAMKAQCATQGNEGVNLNEEVSRLLANVGQLLKNIASLAGQLNAAPPVSSQPAPVQPPNPSCGCHPAGSLKKDSSGVITTPGGYKIEATSTYEWKVTGPDGKSTRVWGDPHVDESDGGKWDFKRDSTFVLGDGTRINCGVTPYGNGAFVTKQLEVISGNDRVMITDIDKGAGKVGNITQDGFANVNSFGGKEVFVMGKETDDWSFQGKEVIGSNNGGDSFKLGKDLAPLLSTVNPFGGGAQWASALLNALGGLFKAMSSLQDSQPKASEKNCWDPRAVGRRNPPQLEQPMNSIAGIFNALAQITKMSSQVSFGLVNQNLNA